MKLFRDLLPILKKHTLTLKERKQEIGDIYTFVFHKNSSISWTAGQHGIFSFDKTKLEGGAFRGFSIASEPEDEHIMISVRIGEHPSAFKQKLLSMETGDKISMRGPFGPFYISNPSKAAVFIAGGIGITPYRALIQSFGKGGGKVPKHIDLLYIDSRGNHVYRDLFDELSGKYENLNVKYLLDRDSLVREVESCIAKYGNDSDYFISGPPDMVKKLKKELVEKGVRKNNVHNEMFIGY